MQAAMDRLASFLERRRWLVLGAWLVLLLAAAPFAAKQTDHLTSGGFEVPGSHSQIVDRNLGRFQGAQREYMAVVVARREGGDVAAVRHELDRVALLAGRQEHAEVDPREG